MDNAKTWALRLAHESQMHEANSWITLTYSDDHLPDDYSISVREIQRFMKRLRKQVGSRIRFFACGEYGERNHRPHYHLAIFGHDFPDKTLWRKSPAGSLLYRSKSLETVWTSGHSEIGALTYESAGYTARYMLKKVGGEMAEEHYRRIHPITGVECQVRPEFICMSSRPGIGSSWYDKFSGDAFPSDFVVLNGVKHQVPRYYFKKLQAREDADQLRNPSDAIKQGRTEKAREHEANNTPDRLAVREEVQQLRIDRLIRSMESET